MLHFQSIRFSLRHDETSLAAKVWQRALNLCNLSSLYDNSSFFERERSRLSRISGNAAFWSRKREYVAISRVYSSRFSIICLFWLMKSYVFIIRDLYDNWYKYMIKIHDYIWSVFRWHVRWFRQLNNPSDILNFRFW